MTELSWLVSFLLDQKLSPKVKVVVAERIRYVEAQGAPKPLITHTQPARPVVVDPSTAQSPSTQRILDEMAAAAPPPEQAVIRLPPVTAVAANALANRAALMRGAASKKGPIADEETGRPRKW